MVQPHSQCFSYQSVSTAAMTKAFSVALVRDGTKRGDCLGRKPPAAGRKYIISTRRQSEYQLLFLSVLQEAGLLMLHLLSNKRRLL